MKKLLFFLIILSTKVWGQDSQQQSLSRFVPNGYVLYEKVNGDLNKDGVEDWVLIIKGTDTSKIITHEHRGRLDRNRRGIIILLNKNSHYEIAAENYECFSSENEDGGVYYAPELSFNINKGNLYIHYAHGRYGYWQYTFRFQNSNFELIGYDQSNNYGPIINSETSINFSTRKKQIKENINDDSEIESGEEIFKTSLVNIKVDSLIKLSNIKDFDELDMSVY